MQRLAVFVSMVPTQQDKALANPLGLAVCGDKFLFSQGVNCEGTQDHTKAGIHGTFEVIY